MKKADIDLSTCVKLYSNFAYHENADYKIDAISTFHTRDSIEKEFLLGKNIPHSDLYAVEIVARLSFATTDMVFSELQFMKNSPNYADVILPSIDRSNVRNSLIRMCQTGLLRNFSYISYNNPNVKISIYCASDMGIKIVKKRLYSNVADNDTMPSLCPEEEAFRRLAANACVIALRERYGYSKILFNKNLYIPRIGKKRIYGKCEYLEGDVVHIRIIEPLYFKASSSRVPKGRMESVNLERFQILNQYVKNMQQKYSDENIDLKIIFLYENTDGLKKCVKMAVQNLDFIQENLDADVKYALEHEKDYMLTKDNAPCLKNICFSSEPLLYFMEEKQAEFIGISKFSTDTENITFNKTTI